jgi:hypothetical protein
MQFADLALGHCDEPHAGKAQALQQPGDILLIARKTIERLGDDDVELAAAGVFEKALITGRKALAPLTARSV